MNISTAGSFLAFSAISTHVFFLYRVPLDFPVSVTIDRLLLLGSTIVFFIIGIRRPLRGSNIPVIWFILAVSSLTVSILAGVGGAFPSRGMLLYVALIYFLITYLALEDPGRLKFLGAAFVFVTGILCLYTAWYYGMFFSTGAFPRNVPGSESLFFFNIAEPELSQGSAFWRRATLPYVRSQDLGLSALLCFLVISWVRAAGQLRLSAPIYLATSWSLFFLVLLSQSRSALFPLVIAVGYVLFSQIKKRISTRKILVGTFWASLILLSSMMLYSMSGRVQDSISSSLNRIDEATYASHLEYRMTAIMTYVDLPLKKVFFGLGPEGFGVATGHENARASAHSTILVYLTELGLIGTLLFMFLYLYILAQAIRMRGCLVPEEFRWIMATIIALGLANLFYNYQVTIVQWIVFGALAGRLHYSRLGVS